MWRQWELLWTKKSYSVTCKQWWTIKPESLISVVVLSLSFLTFLTRLFLKRCDSNNHVFLLGLNAVGKIWNPVSMCIFNKTRRQFLKHFRAKIWWYDNKYDMKPLQSVIHSWWAVVLRLDQSQAKPLQICIIATVAKMFSWMYFIH